ncbi:MAG: redoxin family protein [Bacteroidetes bacterium]|nr:redoxin family protein [Bacteroidota bacterium]
MGIIQRIFMAVLLCLSAQHAGAQAHDSIRVYIFLAETCPICRSTTIEMKNLYSGYHDKGIAFTGVFPSAKMSTEQTRAEFTKKYSIPYPLQGDAGQRLTKKYNATITPEIVVVRVKDDKVLYRGKVDNSYEAIGRRREVVTEHYLHDALESILHGKKIGTTKTEPVGCFIEKT